MSEYKNITIKNHRRYESDNDPDLWQLIIALTLLFAGLLILLKIAEYGY